MTHDTHDTGGQVLDLGAEIRQSERELRAAAKAEALDDLDDLLDRIRGARDGAAPASFLKGAYQRLLDQGLESRRRFFHEGNQP